ncbi:hypothetical protein AMJ40_03775 [candidate division TA06 bacterium DG_26]|uniref:Probable nicotinate-nucleotide adenylyltransferase n=1 Tax=candidate division TA06 bacterium DG_26 TaxID=1703771 RepID=A0A0S7WIS0_UNCT6|nr:MAG: hypothetical protein AMJ40_03775 [candidate division TA06 bacterium DG_26]
MTALGLFGGSFDPPHLGHLIVTQEVLSTLNLDRVLFIPAHIPPHKETVAGPQERYEMTSLAIAGNPNFEISDIELKRKDKSYTVETLGQLHTLFRAAQFYLIMGADEFSEIETWKDPEGVLSLSTVVVMMRPGYELGRIERTYRNRFLPVRVPQIEISSTDIRMRVRGGKSITYLVPPRVEAYIEEKRLYR